MNGDLVESLDVEGFGDFFQVQHPSDVTCVGFQNCGPQPQMRHNKRTQDGAMVMAGGKYDVLLVAEHGLYPPALDTKEGWHDRMCMTMKSPYSRLSYNTNDGEAIHWNQFGGTGVTITADMKFRMASKGEDQTKLGR